MNIAAILCDIRDIRDIHEYRRDIHEYRRDIVRYIFDEYRMNIAY